MCWTPWCLTMLLYLLVYAYVHHPCKLQCQCFGGRIILSLKGGPAIATPCVILGKPFSRQATRLPYTYSVEPAQQLQQQSQCRAQHCLTQLRAAFGQPRPSELPYEAKQAGLQGVSCMRKGFRCTPEALRHV